MVPDSDMPCQKCPVVACTYILKSDRYMCIYTYVTPFSTLGIHLLWELPRGNYSAFHLFPYPRLSWWKKSGSPPDFGADPTSTMVVDTGTSDSGERITRRSRIALATGTPIGDVT